MIVNYNCKDVKLPDFLIVGAAKSGTTSLHYYLKQHPGIFMPKAKELWFFCFMDVPPQRAVAMGREGLTLLTLDDYIDCFKDAVDGQVIGETTPTYLYFHKNTIRNIKTVYGERYRDVKILMILRNPAERAWSHFMMRKRNYTESLEGFREVISPDVVISRRKQSSVQDYIGMGMYYEQVKAFMDEFPIVKVFLYDELCADALKVVKEMFCFFGVDEEFTPNTKEKYNISGDAKFNWLNKFIFAQYPLKGFLKPLIPYEIKERIKQVVNKINLQRREMSSDIRREVIERYYKDNIIKLQFLIKRDLSAWMA